MAKKDFLKDYVEVNERVEKFWNDYPEGRINTEIIKWENEVITMKANVYKDSKNQYPDSTGHAYEKEGSSYINKTSALENCETSAVGRALALMGYEIKKSIASKEEVQNAVHQQEELKKKIDSTKVKTLEQLAKTKKSDIKQIANYYKVNNISDMNLEQWQNAMKHLKSK